MSKQTKKLVHLPIGYQTLGFATFLGKLENQLWSTLEGLLNNAVRETITSSTSYRCSF